jgi:hypothetical protein
VTVFLDGIDLRYARLGNVEVLRRVYVAVRDAGWNTIPGIVSELKVANRANGFSVHFSCRHQCDELDFAWRGAISGREDGTLEYSVDGIAERSFKYNRIGICVHHPWREARGATYRASTPNGIIEGVLPDLIGPQRLIGTYQPLFPSYNQLSLALPGEGSVLLECAGDLWETEDQRNWSDASFKSYSTPISLPLPHQLTKSQTLRQSITTRFEGMKLRPSEPQAARIAVGTNPIGIFPAVGLGMDRDGHALSKTEAQLVSVLRPTHIRIDIRPSLVNWRAQLLAAMANAARVDAHLELALFIRPTDAVVLDEVVKVIAHGPPIDRVIVLSADGRVAAPDETTPPRLFALARDALSQSAAEAPIVGGTEMYFAELNRTPPSGAPWGGICYSISPQVHGFTDIDIVENLEAQAETVRSARALSHGTPIIVSPVTLRPRHNFHAAGRDREPGPGELPDSVDPRQASLLGAAWTVGSLKYLAEAGATSTTYFETTGLRGVIERSEPTERSNLFPSTPRQAFPLFHAIADAVAWRGVDVLPAESSDPHGALAVAVRDHGVLTVVIASVRPSAQDVIVSGIAGNVRMRRLNLSTVEGATRDPKSFRGKREVQAVTEGGLRIRLGPYETIRVDQAG